MRILISLLLIAGGAFASYKFDWLYEIPTLIGGGLFLLGLFFSGVFALNQGYFYIELTTNQIGENAVMSVGYEKLRQKLAVKKIKISVDNKSARDIIERLGAYIFENRK